VVWNHPSTQPLSQHKMAVKAGTKRHFSLDKPGTQGAKRRKVKRQQEYHSSSSEADSDSDSDAEKPTLPTTVEQEIDEPEKDEEQSDNEDAPASEQLSSQLGSDADSSDESDGESTQSAAGVRKKRNDPSAFATSMQKILTSKLTTSKRADPVLSRSKDAAEAVKEVSEARLEAAARTKIRQERKAMLDVGRETDVLGLQSTEISTEDIIAREKRYKKTAQMGVIRLFNAVLQAQVRGREAAREQRSKGTIGMEAREKKVNEMSKQGFLDLIAGGGKQKDDTPS